MTQHDVKSGREVGFPYIFHSVPEQTQFAKVAGPAQP